MTRYMCPNCEGGGMVLLSDSLECSFCGGHYTWKEKDVKSTQDELCKCGHPKSIHEKGGGCNHNRWGNPKGYPCLCSKFIKQDGGVTK